MSVMSNLLGAITSTNEAMEKLAESVTRIRDQVIIEKARLTAAENGTEMADEIKAADDALAQELDNGGKIMAVLENWAKEIVDKENK